jgi:probable HAF family extracellular repeat protein
MNIRNAVSLFICLYGPHLLVGCGGGSAAPPPAVATHFSVSGPTTATAGTPFNITVTALDASNKLVTTYTGMLHFSSSDPQAVLPHDSSLPIGIGTFSITLKTAAAATITGIDIVNASLSGISNSIQVSGSPVTHFLVAAPASAVIGASFGFAVSALDASNNVATGYTGIVHFTSTDAKAILPGDLSLRNGTAAPSATFKTAGPQTITATDTVTPSITGTSGSISVSTAGTIAITSGAPPNGMVGTGYGRCRGGQCRGFQLTASGGIEPYTWTWIPATGSSLPPGLVLSGIGYLTGIPSVAGSYTVIVTVTDSAASPSYVSTSYTLAISASQSSSLTISSETPPNGSVGALYSPKTTGYCQPIGPRCVPCFPGGSTRICGPGYRTLYSSEFDLRATGGTPPYSWSWVQAQNSSLPAGLNLSPDGKISGTPTSPGSYTVVVNLSDSGSPGAQASANYTIVISNPSSAAASAMATPSSKERHTRYRLIDVGTLGGPNSNIALSLFNGVVVPTLSQNGTFVGQADTSIPDPFVPNCFNFDCYVSHAIKWNEGVRTDLGSLPGLAGLSSAPTWISGNGLIAGFSENGEVDPFTGIQSAHGVVWKHGEILDLGTLKGGYESVANGINNRGVVVGYANNSIPDPESLAGMGSQTRAVAWWNGEVHDLGTLGGTDAAALYVNDLGQIVGQSYTSTSVPPPIQHCTDYPLTLHAFIWENGHMNDLKTLGGTCAFAYALNNRGQVVGQANLAGDSESHPFLWERGVMKDLGALGGTYGYAGWLNDSGEVVGAATNPLDEALLAFSWKEGAMTNLGTLNGNGCSAADAVNSKGQVVGGSGLYDAAFFSACTDAVEHAVLWEDGKILDLNSLVSAPSELTLNEATSINDHGEISGFGSLANGDTHAFVMIPCDANHPDVEDCDYEPVEAVTGAQAQSALIPQTQAASPSKASPEQMMLRFRTLVAGHNRRYGMVQTSPK